MKTLEPKIYVACLASYNNGILHGAWIDVNQDRDSLYEEINKMLACSPMLHAEEWAIHDFIDFGGIHINEYIDLETVVALAKLINEHGELGANVYCYTNNLDDTYHFLEECYHGEFNCEEDFAHYWIHEVEDREIPDYLKNYIDYQAMARDFFINDFLSIETDSKIHVFSHF